MKIFQKGSEDYGKILKRLVDIIDKSLSNSELKNEERDRLHIIMDFIKLYGTANKINHKMLKVLMRVSFCKDPVNAKIRIWDEA